MALSLRLPSSNLKVSIVSLTNDASFFCLDFFSSIGVSEEVLTRGSFCWGLGTAAVGLESSEKLQPSLQTN